MKLQNFINKEITFLWISNFKFTKSSISNCSFHNNFQEKRFVPFVGKPDYI
jgi:hypothetical protein